MVENFDEFYNDFYEGQFEWYDQKAITNKRRHRIFEASEILLATFLPVSISLFPVTTNPFWKYTTVGASVLLLIIESLGSTWNFQKKWLNYRTTAEGLRREKQMFRTKTGDYDGVEDPEKLFVERVTSLTSQENRYWEITTRKAQE